MHNFLEQNFVPLTGHHKISVNSQLSILGLGKPKEVKPLTPEAAMELGTEIVGDLVIILCGLGIYILFESRGAFKSKDTTLDKTIEEVNLLKERVKELNSKLDEQTDKLQNIESMLKQNMYSETSEKVLKRLDVETNRRLSNLVMKR